MLRGAQQYTPVMCNVGQYPLFCGYWARQLALKYINCGQSSLYKNHLTENDECLVKVEQRKPHLTGLVYLYQHSNTVNPLSHCLEARVDDDDGDIVLVKCDNNEKICTNQT